MGDSNNADWDREFDRDTEREPSRRYERRRRHELTGYGTLRRAHEDAHRCATCGNDKATHDAIRCPAIFVLPGGRP